MEKPLTHREELLKQRIISVPNKVQRARVELLTFKGAPAFLGTVLAKLHMDDDSVITLYSKMSGVVDRILVHNEQIVSQGQRLFELRNTNISRTKSGSKMRPSVYPLPQLSYGNFFETQKNREKNEKRSEQHSKKTLNYSGNF